MVELKLKQATIEVERLGELFLINRDRMIATDKQRNSTREALAALRKLHGEETAWIQDSSNSISRYGTIAAGAVLEAGTRVESSSDVLVIRSVELFQPSASLLELMCLRRVAAEFKRFAVHVTAVLLLTWLCRGSSPGKHDVCIACGTEAPYLPDARQGCHPRQPR
jgi:hypothetical protein